MTKCICVDSKVKPINYIKQDEGPVVVSTNGMNHWWGVKCLYCGRCTGYMYEDRESAVRAWDHLDFETKLVRASKQVTASFVLCWNPSRWATNLVPGQYFSTPSEAIEAALKPVPTKTVTGLEHDLAKMVIAACVYGGRGTFHPAITEIVDQLIEAQKSNV